jgi:hypothetical protein
MFVCVSGVMAQAEPTPDVTPEATPIVRESVQGSISGLITVGTPNITLPADTIVTLHIFDIVTETESTLTTPITPDNTYLFSDVTITDGDFYFVSVAFDGRNYGSTPVTGNTEFPNLDLPVVVYMTTTDPDVIGIMNLVVQIQPTEGVLGFTQVIQFRNQSDRMYLGDTQLEDGRRVTLDLSVPVGALVTELLVMVGNQPVGSSDASFIVDTSTFSVRYTDPIYPGQDYLFIMNYVMPYEQDAVMEFPIGHRFIGEMRILTSTDELRVSGENLQSLGIQMMGEEEYLGYGGRFDLMPDDLIRYELSGRVAGVGEFDTNPQPARVVTAVSSDNLPLLLLIIGFGIVVIVVGGVIVINRRKNLPQQPIEGRFK